MRCIIAIAGLAFITGCTGGKAEDGDLGPGDPLLGNGDPSQIDVEVILSSKLDTPRDLAFNPLVPDELWVVNQETDSATVIEHAGADDQKATKFDENSSGPHFLAQPAGIAFGDNGNMATIHNTDEKTQGPNGTPGDFMGPTMWTTDLEIFDGGHSSHLDMLHNSPLGVGIEWEVGNAYWVVDGANSSVTRYDFAGDHGLGGADHSDGVIARYIEGDVKRAESGCHAGMWYDHDTDELYVSDSGNNRILVLDTVSGDRGQDTAPNYDGGDQYKMKSADFRVLIEGDEFGMIEPSGLDVYGDTIYVADAGIPAVFAFSMSGELIDFAEIDNDINGIAVDGSGNLYFVDPVANEVLRLNR